MRDGLIVVEDGGSRLDLGPLQVTFKLGENHSQVATRFVTEVEPGVDVGAHIHEKSEEVFFVLEGEIEILTFQPEGGITSDLSPDWRSWKSHKGESVARVGPGTLVFIPPGCPHAFYNPGPGKARFLVEAVPEHESYMRELAQIVRHAPEKDRASMISALRQRYDIRQLTPLVMPDQKG